jgi:hypothetical protein
MLVLPGTLRCQEPSLISGVILIVIGVGGTLYMFDRDTKKLSKAD